VARITFVQAVFEALIEEMERDPLTFVLGLDVTRGTFGRAAGFFERFGPQRILDMPLSEAGFVGAAVGAAMAGTRPICEVQFASFFYCAFDQLCNQAAKLRYMSGGQVRLPITFRTRCGAVGGAAAQHSETVYPQLLSVPGLKLVMASGPADAKGLLKSAIRDDNPVVFFEHLSLGGSREEVPEGEHLVPLGKAAIKREGKDVTVIAIGAMVPKAMAVAQRLNAEGISIEVIDPRTLIPLDEEAILASVAKTNRVVVADEAHVHGSVASEIGCMIAEKGFDYLDAPIKRVTAMDCPVPFSPPLEKAVVPGDPAIERAVREVMG
jgi:pyruvate/2-oxoglutarate/acetoin dehydrogenase E1 component